MTRTLRARRGCGRTRRWLRTGAYLVALAAMAATNGVLEAAPSTTPRLDWLFNGNVNTTARVGNRLYVGGQFRSATPAGGVSVARSAIAGFDLTTGALLPADLTVSYSVGGSTVQQMVAGGTVLYFKGEFDAVNGQARPGIAAVDVATNTLLAWPAPGATVLDFAGPVTATHVYVLIRPAGEVLLRRLDVTTGAIDATWTPPVLGGVTLDHGMLWVVGAFPSTGAAQGSFVGTLDLATAEYHEVLRSSLFAKAVRVDGDTLYLAGAIPGSPNPLALYYAIFGVDRKTLVPVSSPPISGPLNHFEVIGGRVIVAGGTLTTSAGQRYGLFEVDRSGVPTGWDSGFRLSTGVFGLKQVALLDRYGDVLVAAGDVDSDVYRVAVYDLAGTDAPAGLRSQLVGQDTVFTWEPMASSPPGGYVIEGGFAAGQTAASLAVGTATSVALPMPAGPVFIRVRPQGSTEVSNEIVAGCLAPPLPPTALTTTIAGTTLTLAWTPPAASVTTYTLLAGTAAGLSNVVTLPLGPQTSVSGTVPGGTFFARVTASNPCGTSGPSGEVFFTIGAPDPLPAAPTNVAAVTGSTVSLTWTAPAGPVIGYVLEGGTALGLANLGAIQVGAVTSFVAPGAPPGVYAVRVRAITSAGSGAPSADVVVVVP